MNWLITLWENFIHGLTLFRFETSPGYRAAKIEEMGKQLYAEIEACRPKPIQGIELVSYAELEDA